MLLGRKRTAIFFLVFALRAFHSLASYAAPNEKCRSKSYATDRFPHCMDSNDSTIWCDQSNYTRIPKPGGHSNFDEKVAREAVGLLINDSCIKDLQIGDLAGYESIKLFDASYNYISVLRNMVFSDNKKLERITLRGNEISVLEAKAFRGLIELQHLDLSNNKISDIPDRIWYDLSSLKTLYLDGNNLAVVNRNSFARLPNLAVLHLRRNRIEHIKSDSFSLQSLEELLLDSNRIQEIDNETLSGSPVLQHLSLSSNMIKVWPKGYGKTFKKLRYLNLGSNDIGEFTAEHIELLTELTYLALDDNNLKTIDKKQFSTTIRLQFLSLGENYIGAIPEDTFGALRNIKTLFVQGNKLSTPHARWFEHLDKQSNAKVNLGENDWHCDCGIVNFQNYVDAIRSRQPALSSQLRVACSSPKSMKGKNLDPYSFAEMKHKLRCEVAAKPSPSTNHFSTITPTPSETTRKSTSARKAVNKTSEKDIITYKTTAATKHIYVDPEPGTPLQSYYPAPRSENGKLSYAVVAALVAVIIIGLGAVYLVCRRQQCRIRPKRLKPRLDSTNSTKPMLEDECEPPSVNNIYELFSDETRHGDEVVIPMTLNPSNPSYSERNYREGTETEPYYTPTTRPKHFYTNAEANAHSNRDGAEREPYHTPSTQPKQLYTNAEANAHRSTLLIKTVVEPIIPRQRSNDSFRSCTDLSGNFDNVFHSIPDNKNIGFDIGPPSSFDCHAPQSRQSGDGAEAHISC